MAAVTLLTSLDAYNQSSATLSASGVGAAQNPRLLVATEEGDAFRVHKVQPTPQPPTSGDNAPQPLPC